MDGQKQPLVAWRPAGLSPELAGVMVPRGSRLEEGDWWEALVARVQDLVDKEPDPEEAAQWAARTLGLPGLRDSRDAGEVLVQHNLELRTSMSVQMQSQRRYPFPAKAMVDRELVQQAIEETDLEMWVELAASQVSASSLD